MGDVDQGREGLRGMRGGNKIQGGIPGEGAVGVQKGGKWGKRMASKSKHLKYGGKF